MPSVLKKTCSKNSVGTIYCVPFLGMLQVNNELHIPYYIYKEFYEILLTVSIVNAKSTQPL